MVNLYPEAIKQFPESMQIVIKRMVHRVYSGRNVLAIFVGQTGSSKSLSTIQIYRGCYLYMHGREPNEEKIISHIFFKAKPFVEAMQKLSEKLNETQKTTPDLWVWDEVGAGASNRQWQSVNNQVISWLIQTFRNLQQIVFFTVPSISFIDVQIRKLLHYYFETITIDRKMKIAYIKPLVMQYNTRMDKIYYHNFSYTEQDGEIIEVDTMAVPKISDNLERLYEEKKNKFTYDLNTQILAQLNKIEAKTNNTYNLTPRQQEIVELINKGITSTQEIGVQLGLPATTISTNLSYISKKGLDIRGLRDLR